MVVYNALETEEEWEWPAHPEDDLWYYQKVQCNWIYDLVVLAGERTLEEEDVWTNPKMQVCVCVYILLTSTEWFITKPASPALAALS